MDGKVQACEEDYEGRIENLFEKIFEGVKCKLKEGMFIAYVLQV